VRCDSKKAGKSGSLITEIQYLTGGLSKEKRVKRFKVDWKLKICERGDN
jgi:hypothetical protein